ncbi:hypothetical protein SGPA1_40548 [Streptomyces misionensis JCM 4497]
MTFARQRTNPEHFLLRAMNASGAAV